MAGPRRRRKEWGRKGEAGRRRAGGEGKRGLKENKIKREGGGSERQPAASRFPGRGAGEGKKSRRDRLPSAHPRLPRSAPLGGVVVPSAGGLCSDPAGLQALSSAARGQL